MEKKHLPKETSNEERCHLFIMRCQPLHNGHVELLKHYLDREEPVLVMLMEIPFDSQNPFSFTERLNMFWNTFTDAMTRGLLKVLNIPPVVSVNVGRECGYSIERLDSRGKEYISATEIRKLIRDDNSCWQDLVPNGTTTVIIEKQMRGERI